MKQKSIDKFLHSYKNRRHKLKLDNRGVAGLDVFLSVIVMLFVIGFLVMIFALMGGELQDSLDTQTTNNLTARQTINDTINALSDATDWFGIIIVITAMVVLILLTVIIITAIRGTGLITA